MNRILLLAMLGLCLLPGCAHTALDDSPANDLQAAKAQMHRTLKPRPLPNGKMYCAELATGQLELDECTGDLEDGKFASEQDKAIGLRFFDKFIQRLMLARDPCNALERLFRVDRCKIPHTD